MTIVELTDDDFAAMLRGDRDVRPGLAQPPGGVDEPVVLEHVRRIAEELRRDGYPGGQWMMVADGEVVGLCGIKTPPSAEGDVELGYGVAASRRRRGHATAAIAALIKAARRDPAVRAILALTAPDNVASHRVLTRNGFSCEGAGIDPQDGAEILRWRKSL
jgi:RimJ/RimL family protein N-acetyltransferase